MKRQKKHRAYLVAATQDHQPQRVYAVLARSSGEALAAAATAAAEGAAIEVTGELSMSLAKSLKLKLGNLSEV